MTDDRLGSRNKVHLSLVAQPSRSDPCERITARPPPFPGILAPDRLAGDISFSEEIAKKIAETGNLRIISAKEGHVDPKLISVIGKSINASIIKERRFVREGSDAPQTQRAQNALAKFDNVLAAKTILNTAVAMDSQDSDSLLCALAKCLDEGDYHIRLHAILGFTVHASRGGEIFEYLGLLAERLDDVIPLIREAACLSLKIYAAQGSHQAHNAHEISSSAKSPDLVSSIRASAERTIQAEVVKARPRDEETQTAQEPRTAQEPESERPPSDGPLMPRTRLSPQASLHAKRMSILKDSLLCSDYDSSIEAFTQLIAHAHESASNAREVLALLDGCQSKDALVLDLIENCRKLGTQ